MIKQDIQKNITEALKQSDSFVAGTLRMLMAAILSKEKEKKFKEKLEGDVVLLDAEIIDVIGSEIKKRKDAVSFYEKGGRPELAEKENREIEVLKKYLPEQMSEEDLKKQIKDSISKTGAKEMKDMGRVMADLTPKIKGRADSGLASKIVKEILSK